MLGWAVTFFIIAIVAALFGFGGVAGMSRDIGWMLAVLGVIVLVVGIVGRSLGGRGSTLP